MALTNKDLFGYISKYGATRGVSSTVEIPFEQYLAECRRYSSENTPSEYYNWDSERQKEFINNQIIEFVSSHEKPVEGYVSDGELDIVGLIDNLKSMIMDFGILRRALEDDAVQEIQINDKDTIFEVVGGKFRPYVDANGRPFRFDSNEELQATLHRLINNPNGDTPRLTTESPLLNARTSNGGYRVSGVHDIAVTPDVAPYDYPVTTVTIRKYSKDIISLDRLIDGFTLVEPMARLIKMIMMADTRVFFVGPVSSGKTTLMKCFVFDVVKKLRAVFTQNPTEILLYDRDETGVNSYNVVHWEAVDVPKDKWTSSKNTVSNLVNHALRNSPDIIILGEGRAAEEFYEIYRAMLTGHRVGGTYHSSSAAGAVERFATEVATATGGSKTEYISSVAEYMDCIVSQYKLIDGSRKVMSIGLPTGKILDTGRPEVIEMFKFVNSRKAIKDENGEVTKILGYFEQVGVIDKDSEFAEKLYSVGYSEADLEEFTNESYKGRRFYEDGTVQ